MEELNKQRITTKLELKSKGFRKEKILIDGKELRNITKIQVNMSSKEVPTVTVQLIPDEISVDGDFYFIREKPLKDYNFEDLYKAIGEKIKRFITEGKIR